MTPLTKLVTFVKGAKKAVVALLGGLAVVAAAGALPSPADKWAPTIIAAATAAGVYGVRNTPKGGPAAG